MKTINLHEVGQLCCIFLYSCDWLRNPFPMSSLLERCSSEHRDHHTEFRTLFLAPTLQGSRAQAAAPRSNSSRVLAQHRKRNQETRLEFFKTKRKWRQKDPEYKVSPSSFFSLWLAWTLSKDIISKIDQNKNKTFNPKQNKTKIPIQIKPCQRDKGQKNCPRERWQGLTWILFPLGKKYGDVLPGR